jgi:hypothetical protein
MMAGASLTLKRSSIVLYAVLALTLGFGCKSRSTSEAEAKRDVPWLGEQGTPEAVAALGRLADTEPRALAALEARAGSDVNTYIAAWGAVLRNAAWGATFIRAGLGDPARAEMTASALPRRDARMTPFVPDLEASIVRLAAGRGGSLVAGVLSSIGPPAHAAIERRLIDPKTRGAMCDGISVPEASGDSKSLVLAVPADARDHSSCVGLVLEMAATEDVVLGWLATGAEPGLLNAAAKSTLACPRVATIWRKGLIERPAEAQTALAVPLQRSLARCASALDPVLGELLAKAPRARTTIVMAIDPFGGDLQSLPRTCTALKEGYANNESPRVRERARDAIAHGCAFAR